MHAIRFVLRGLLLVAVSSAASALPAQFHQNGWFLPGVGHIHRYDPGGVITSAQVSSRAVYAATMNRDNRAVLLLDTSIKAILEIDPLTFAVRGTFHTDPGFSSVNSVQDMTIDHDGDFYFTSTSPRKGVFKIAGGRLTTVAAGSPFQNGAGNLSIDIDTGELLVTDPPFMQNGFVYRVRRDGSAITTIGIGLDPRYGTYQHVLTGDIFSGACCGDGRVSSPGKSLLVIPKSTGASVVFVNNATLEGAYCPRPDRASAAQQRLVVAAFGSPSVAGSNGVWSIDITTATPTKLSSVSTGSLYRAVPIFGRNVNSVRTGPGSWNVFLSVPGQPNRSWVSALSTSGVRPAVRLPDGRNLPIAIDAVTFAGWAGALAPIVSNTSGPLGPEGGGVFFLDVSSVNVPPGFVLHVVVAVLDPAAPLGLALITDPHPIVLERR